MKQFGRRPSGPSGGDNIVALSRAPAPPAAAGAPPASGLAGAAPPASPPAALERLRGEVLARVDPAFATTLEPVQLREQLELLIHEVATQDRLEITARDQAVLAEELVRDMMGYGPLDPLLRDETVTDIMVNGPDCVYVERRGLLHREPVRFRSTSQLNSIAQKMAASVGRRVDEASPLVDCRLPDGSRVNVVFPPLALNGACISIRKFAAKPFRLEDMVANGSMSPGVGRALEIAGRCRLNILVSGGTGSGKTTLLNAISRCIDPGERIVTIEDAAELQLQQPHVIRLETRPANLEGRGEVTQRDLLKNALRMRPDRIIMGEVRGAEVFEMLQAMNTGHDGSLCTIHANNPREALTRVENMVQMGGVTLPVRAMRTQIASAVDLIIQVQRMRDGQRRVTHVTEVSRMEGDIVTLNDLFVFRYGGETEHGRITGVWDSTAVRPGFMERLNYFGLDTAWIEAASGAVP